MTFAEKDTAGKLGCVLINVSNEHSFPVVLRSSASKNRKDGKQEWLMNKELKVIFHH